jgi:hypothetical protein
MPIKMMEALCPLLAEYVDNGPQGCLVGWCMDELSHPAVNAKKATIVRSQWERQHVA